MHGGSLRRHPGNNLDAALSKIYVPVDNDHFDTHCSQVLHVAENPQESIENYSSMEFLRSVKTINNLSALCQQTIYQSKKFLKLFQDSLLVLC